MDDIAEINFPCGCRATPNDKSGRSWTLTHCQVFGVRPPPMERLEALERACHSQRERLESLEKMRRELYEELMTMQKALTAPGGQLF